MSEANKRIVKLLTTAYSMEIETVLNYLANSVNLDGVRAEEIKKSLSGRHCRRNHARSTAGPAD